MIYEFDEFQFEPANARLSRRGVLLHAEPKALRVLEVLLEAKGSLVDRDTLLNLVWGRVIVTPGTLTRLIAELRRLLGDDSLKPRYIETVHTKGYRWIAAVASAQRATSRSAPPQRSIELIGRDDDLTQLQVIAATARLLTLAGPGGTGKTQLALELGRRREGQQPQSVVWIDLTAARNERALPGLVSTALDVQLPDGVDFASGVARAIGDRELLLLFDNCEHLAGNLAASLRTIWDVAQAYRSCAQARRRSICRKKRSSGSHRSSCRARPGTRLQIRLPPCSSQVRYACCEIARMPLRPISS